MQAENYDNLKSAVRNLLAKANELPSPEKIRKVIAEYRCFPPYSLDDLNAEKMAREFENSLGISMEIGSVVVDENFVEWLPSAKPSIDPYFWERYRTLLEIENFPPKVIAKLDSVTDRIVGLLGNPKDKNSWDRRGMVVGHVQSGKTANYTGVICKAADAGYKLIIIIAGIHNNLRNQTQKRIDEGFIGRDSARIHTGNQNKFIGVGKIDSQRNPIPLTSSIKDFHKTSAGTNQFSLSQVNEAAVLVIKKNVSTLRNVINWLKEHNAKGLNDIIDAPMLLIDDEADNASIDISKSPDESSRINSQIRELLNQFHRSCYVGYTATPFANIFIDPANKNEMIGEDLFPKNFIVGLDAPDNYMGANKIFNYENQNNVTREIIDNEDLLPVKHKNNFEINGLPSSLETAIRTFILCKSIRILRGDKTSHNSMLINTSRFTSVQSDMRDVIHSFIDIIKRSIRFTCNQSKKVALQDKTIKHLYDVWETEYSHLKFEWEDIQSVLHDGASTIVVMDVNSKSASELNYDDYKDVGLNVIAVGGFSLSRGLTLEGLSISYFLRNSIMYDTLLQMGRWFGYRTRYEDLCRVWMSPEAEGWYEHISESIEELRDEIRKMEKAKLTPIDFGLKVRNHPDSLIVTARNKMGSGEKVNVQVGLGNKFIETATLSKKSFHIKDNKLIGNNLIKKLGHSSYDKTMPSGNYLWRNIDANLVMEFISSFNNHPRSLHTSPEPVTQYIQDRCSDELKNWDVVLISLNDKGIEDESLGLKVLRQNRTVGRDSKDSKEYMVVTNKSRIASPSMEAIGMDSSIVRSLISNYEEKQKQILLNKNEPIPKGKKFTVPGRIYREKRTKPLLILHLLTMLRPKENENEQEQELHLDEGVLGWSISFPETKKLNKTVNYLVTSTWWKENYGEDFDEEDNGDV
jgi:hypothetical protein